MTFRELLSVMQCFLTANPDDGALDQQVIIRLGVPSGDDDEDLYVGGLQSAVVDAGCTDARALVLDADQDADADADADATPASEHS